MLHFRLLLFAKLFFGFYSKKDHHIQVEDDIRVNFIFIKHNFSNLKLRLLFDWMIFEVYFVLELCNPF